MKSGLFHVYINSHLFIGHSLTQFPVPQNDSKCVCDYTCIQWGFTHNQKPNCQQQWLNSTVIKPIMFFSKAIMIRPCTLIPRRRKIIRKAFLSYLNQCLLVMDVWQQIASYWSAIHTISMI